MKGSSRHAHAGVSTFLLLLAGLALLAPCAGSASRRQAGARITGRKGVLHVVLRGLPPGVAGRVVVTSPRGFRRVVKRSTRLRLGVGTYRMAAHDVRGGSFSAAAVVPSRRVVIVAGREVTVTVRYRSTAPAPSAPPPVPAPTGTPPTVTSVTGAAGHVGSLYVWITVTYTDPECDVVGGTWLNQGEGVFDFGAWGRADLMRNNTCADGVGSLEFARSCVATLRSSERVMLIDANRNRSAYFGFTFSCT